MSLTPKKNGPYGSKATENFTLMYTSETIEALNINSGWVVDGFGFDLVDTTTGAKRSVWYGGKEGSQGKVVFQPGEKITQISGIEGSFNDRPQVAELKFHTDRNPQGYGPYGLAKNAGDVKSFFSPVSNYVLGFFGNSGRFLEGIGIITL